MYVSPCVSPPPCFLSTHRLLISPPPHTHTHHTHAGDPAEARRLLRSGAFEGLRDNVRAVGEYAAAAAAPAPTLASATDFFAAVQALDFVFFKAARDGVAIPVGEAQARLDAAVAALDALLATVDSDVLRAAAEVVGGVGAPPPAAAAAAAAVPATSPLSQILPQAGG